MNDALSFMYSSFKLVLWVEDETTRLALTSAWPGDPIAFYVGGSNETIRRIAEHAWRAGHRNVFGVVDRDFGRTNSHLWAAPPNDLHTYVLESHEIENFALDARSVAECAYNTAGLSENDVTARMDEAAQAMTWWMACCAVLADVRGKRNEDFPKFPGSAEQTHDCASATSYVMKSDWFGKHAAALGEVAKTDWVESQIVAQQAKFARTINDGTWKANFSGKQLLHRLTERVYTKGSGANKHDVLLQAVIQRQVETGRLAAELTSLRACLRTRVGLPP